VEAKEIGDPESETKKNIGFGMCVGDGSVSAASLAQQKRTLVDHSCSVLEQLSSYASHSLAF